MISSSEVGGCCWVQVARLPSDRPPTAPEDTTPPLPPWLPPAFSPFNFLLQPPKISDPTTDAAPRISREGVRACKVVLPSNQLLFRNVGRQGAGNFGFEKFSPRTGAPPPPRRPFLDEKYITDGGGDPGMRNITLIIERFQLCEFCARVWRRSGIGDAFRWIFIFSGMNRLGCIF